MNIKALIQRGVDFLNGRSDTARPQQGSLPKQNKVLASTLTTLLDAELVLAYLLGVEKEYLLAHSDEEVEEALIPLFENYLARLEEGEPLAYILKEKEFFGYSFFVDKRVLVPRPETEHVVEMAMDLLRQWDQEGRRVRVLDLGTGSGNIAVAIAKKCEDEQLDVLEEVIALDKEADALEVTDINIAQHNVGHLVNRVESDLLDVFEDEERFDLILANLPYIGEVKHRFIAADTEKHEPHAALFGGEDGLVLYKKLFQQLLEKNVQFEIMIGEFGFAQAEDLSELLSKYFVSDWTLENDYAGIERIFIVNKN